MHHRSTLVANDVKSRCRRPTPRRDITAMIEQTVKIRIRTELMIT
jgi:hypothetical protein